MEQSCSNSQASWVLLPFLLEPDIKERGLKGDFKQGTETPPSLTLHLFSRCVCVFLSVVDFGDKSGNGENIIISLSTAVFLQEK